MMKMDVHLQASLCRVCCLRHSVVVPVAGHLREPASRARRLVAPALGEPVPPSMPVGASPGRATGVDEGPELLPEDRGHDEVDDSADDGVHHSDALHDEEERVLELKIIQAGRVKVPG